MKFILDQDEYNEILGYRPGSSLEKKRIKDEFRKVVIGKLQEANLNYEIGERGNVIVRNNIHCGLRLRFYIELCLTNNRDEMAEAIGHLLIEKGRHSGLYEPAGIMCFPEDVIYTIGAGMHDACEEVGGRAGGKVHPGNLVWNLKNGQFGE